MVLDFSNPGIVGSNSAGGMDTHVHVRVVLFCVGRDIAMGRSPV
jgi:hypothetical protein